jgi:thiol-disulfide isomerase/thioredoxin
MFGQTFMRRSGLLLAILLLSCQGGAAADTEFNISDYEGKVVVLDFWASWCVPCRRSFPWLNDMNARYGDDGLVIIGVNLDQERSEAEAFLAEFPAQFQIHYDKDKTLAKSYDVVAMPSSYVLGPNGEIVKRHYGFKVKKQEEYEAAIVAALESLKQ